MNNYYRFLDGIRGLSIIWVVLHHVPLSLPSWLEPIRQRGDLGVELFFAISGILVTKSLLSTFSKEGSIKIKIKEYFVKRASRIFPPFYATLIVLFTLSLFVSSLSDKLSKISEIIFSFPIYAYNYARFFVDENIPGAFSIFWSLCFEEQFYLLLLVLFILFKKKLSLLMIFLCLSSLSLRLFGAFGTDDIYYTKLQYYTHLRLDAILLGSLYILNHLSIDLFVKKHIKPFGFSMFVLTLTSIYLHRYDSYFSRALNYFLISFSFTGLIIYFFNISSSPVKRIFELGIFTQVGVVSYEIYLVHQVINGFMAKYLRDIHYSVYIFLLLILSFLTAFLFHRYFSSPLNIFLRNKLLSSRYDVIKGTNFVREMND